MIVRLRRLSTSELGTFGVLVIGGLPRFTTCEPPSDGNKHGVSSIPRGIYRVTLQFSSKFGRMMYELVNVPNRSEIKMHWGNIWHKDPKITDTDGCQLIGGSWGLINTKGITQYGVTNSIVKFREFMSLMTPPTGAIKEFQLIISEDY